MTSVHRNHHPSSSSGGGGGGEAVDSSSSSAAAAALDDVMCITPLGSGQEVGRSCHMIEFRNVRIMCDIGIHPGYDGMNGLPYLDKVIDLSTIDLLLITHFHLDHVAALPYLTEKTNFRGKIYMTHPTKAVTRLLLGDYIRLLQMQHQQKLKLLQQQGETDTTTTSAPEVLYTEKDLYNCLNKVICIDYHTVITYQNDGSLFLNNNNSNSSNTTGTTASSRTSNNHSGTVSFYALNAGHVLGACMYYITIGGDRTILYTGDYSMEDDRHLMAAELPFIRNTIPSATSNNTNNATTTTTASTTTTDVLICESTYGVQVHASRTERETRFTTTIERIVTRGGKCLIPVFALGRAQELLLILDEYWQNNPHLQSIPIWYASKLASRALRVYQTYSNMMNVRIRNQMDVSNPFHFKFIQNLKSINVSQTNNSNDQFDDTSPCVVFASPGMLQSGVSRQLFDRWASDPKNGVMIAGYAVEHTLAKEIMLQPKEVMTLDGRKQPLNCLVDYVSFSAHVDFVQNRNFITRVAPKHIVLVHGQKDEMGRLKSALMLQYKHYPENKRPTITMPPNQIEVKLKFARRRSAKVMGQLATTAVVTSKIDNNDEINNNIDDDDDNDRNNDTNNNKTKNRLPVEGEVVQGILVTQNFQSKIVTPSDLATYTPLRVGSIASKLHVPFAGSIHTLQLFLHEMFAYITEQPMIEDHNNNNHQQSSQSLEYDSERTTNSIAPIMYTLHNGNVRIIMGQQPRVVIVEWEASPAGDVLADAVVALIMHAQSSAASIRYTSKPCHRPRDISSSTNNDDDDNDDETIQKKKSKPDSLVSDRLRFVRTILKEQFQNVEAVYDAYKGTYDIVTDTGFESSSDGIVQCQVMVEFDTDDALTSTAKITVECDDHKIASNIQTTLQNAITAAAAVPV